MVREIIKVHDGDDTTLLTTPCKKITDMNKAHEIIRDLIDTAEYNNKEYEDGKTDKQCCGLAANQIGEPYQIVIILAPNGLWKPLINPVIKSRSNSWHESTEGCMSLDGERIVKRYDYVEVCYTKMNKKICSEKFKGFTAVEVQHELDHLRGILV